MSRRATLLAALVLAGCGGGDDFDTARQMGPDPVLPEPSQSLWPDLRSLAVVNKSQHASQKPAGLGDPREIGKLALCNRIGNHLSQENTAQDG